MKESQIIIDHKNISKLALENIAKEFVLREGTNYGTGEFSLEQKIHQVLQQIKDEKVFLLYDQETDSINLATKRDLQDHQTKQI